MTNKLPVGARVVFIMKTTSKQKAGSIGTVAGGLSFGGMIPVDWDCGRKSYTDRSSLMEFHRMKAMFKHGPKIRKRA